MRNKLPHVNKTCKHHGLTRFKLHHDRGRSYYRCMVCVNLRAQGRILRRKRKLVADAGGSCRLCGYSRCSRALQFHHLNPDNKSFCLSGSNGSYEKFKEEAKKCILVCANCHAEIEDGMIVVDQATFEEAS